jgi:hypothetical protein
MVPKRHFFGWILSGEGNKDEADRKPNQVGNQMKGIRNDRNRVRNIATDELTGDEYNRNPDNYPQFAEVFAVIIKRRGLVKQSFIAFHFLNYNFFEANFLKS